MPSKAPEVVLRDIGENIRLAQSFVQGFTLRKFRGDKRTIYAVIRCLEIVSEASRRLPAGIKGRHPGIPWKDIAGAGNVYRHDYEEISTAMVWNTVKAALPDLLAVVEAELQPKPRQTEKKAGK
jgi:uncharacterized protein with HEPN domain